VENGCKQTSIRHAGAQREHTIQSAQVAMRHRSALIAKRLLRTHLLRPGDTLQLAGALNAADHDPVSLHIVCLEDRLTAAARRARVA